jgi:hypothetical protein
MKIPAPITMAVFVAIIATVAITPSIAWAHTAAYNQGHNGGSCSGFTGKDYDHCIVGQNDAADGGNSGSSSSSSSSSSSDHWQIGHDDACNTGHMAPGSHTQDYITGFNQGLRDCHNGNSGSSSNGGSSSSSSTGASSPGEPGHCDKTGYPSCYSIGFSAGQVHPGTSCPSSGHSHNYCAGWNAGSNSVCTGNCAGVPAIPSNSRDIGYNDGTAAAQTDVINCNFIHTQPSGHHTADYKSGYTLGYWDEVDRDKNDDGTVGSNGCTPPPNP